MSKKNPILTLKDTLRQQAQHWPQPGELVYFVEQDHVWLHKIRLPAHARGGEGTKRMCAFLAACDQANMPVCLTADPVDDDAMADGANPTTFHLVRWYQRLGFVPLGPSEDGFLMERSPRPHSTPATLLQDYTAAKVRDMTWDEFQTRWPAPTRRGWGPQ